MPVYFNSGKQQLRSRNHNSLLIIISSFAHPSSNEQITQDSPTLHHSLPHKHRNFSPVVFAHNSNSSYTRPSLPGIRRERRELSFQFFRVNAPFENRYADRGNVAVPGDDDDRYFARASSLCVY